MKRYFILGTDTSCGKTYVTCEWLRQLQRQQHRVLGLKPIASGCVQRNHDWVNEDVEQLEKANGAPYHRICHWLFQAPVSPHLAAQVEHRHVTVDEVIAFCSDAMTLKLDYLLIEGAGGLMVPLNAKETWVDFLIKTNIPVILVVGIRLGCINHALLTATALQSFGIDCQGWVANYVSREMLAAQDNVDTLIERLPYPLLATVPYAGIPFWSTTL